MKQLRNVFEYEFFGYFKNKVFRIITITVALLIIIGLSVPSLITSFFSGEEKEPESGSLNSILLAEEGKLPGITEMLKLSMPDYTIEGSDDIISEKQAKKLIENGEYNCVILLDTELEMRVVERDSTTSSVSGILTEAVRTLRIQNAMINAGMSAEEAAAAFTLPEITIVSTDRGFLERYAQTYALIMLIYISIMMYGQFIAVSIANEKNSRAMELLITSAKTDTLIFGKILGIGMAGFSQILIWIAALLAGYFINSGSLGSIEFLTNALKFPPQTIAFALVFYLLGFFAYASLFGAIGSLVSRVEDINTVSTPVILLFLANFFVAIAGIMTPDATYVKIFSLIPVFSPLIMFVRISMSSVNPLIIALSLLINAATLFFLAKLASNIYRIGVLIYGNPPSLKELRKALKNQKNY